jgi:hypothetical protein
MTRMNRTLYFAAAGLGAIATAHYVLTPWLHAGDAPDAPPAASFLLLSPGTLSSSTFTTVTVDAITDGEYSHGTPRGGPTITTA